MVNDELRSRRIIRIFRAKSVWHVRDSAAQLVVALYVFTGRPWRIGGDRVYGVDFYHYQVHLRGGVFWGGSFFYQPPAIFHRLGESIFWGVGLCGPIRRPLFLCGAFFH